jgi:hypothetical protein
MGYTGLCHQGAELRLRHGNLGAIGKHHHVYGLLGERVR